MLNEQTQLLLGSSNKNPITFITAVKYSASLVKILNNITFLYDPNWEYEEGNPTYPLAFFYIKNLTEVMSSDISTKPMLFYNSASDSENGSKTGVLNVVADNVVIKPKVYKLELIVPANATTINNASFGSKSLAEVMSFMMHNGASYETSTPMFIWKSAEAIFESLLTGLYGVSNEVGASCNALLRQQDYNKNSIEYMWRNRRVIALKNWNGWKFKYLVIQEVDLNKTGENGSFYEGSLTLQELPILTFREQHKITSLSSLSRISSALGTAQKAVANAFVKAMETTVESKL